MIGTHCDASASLLRISTIRKRRLNMATSPGHAKWPDHRVREVPLNTRVIAKVGEDIIADSNAVIRVEEDGHPARHYFPRSDVSMDKLMPSDTTSKCPFKGTARYFNVLSDGHRLPDAAWSYEDPYEEHAALKDRLAFYVDRVPEIRVTEQTPSRQ